VGDVAHLDISDMGEPNIDVYDSHGKDVCSDVLANSLDCTFQSTGTYTILLNDPGFSGRYSIRASRKAS
jgi:hypothetical protein